MGDRTVIRQLHVHHALGYVGVMEQGEKGQFSFTYDRAWVDSKKGFRISLSLPLQRTPHTETAHSFFANLLPEADLRRFLCKRLGISADNDFELLAAIGGECAGALTLTSAREAPNLEPGDYRALKPSDLEELAAHHVLPALDGQKGLRLSLAGAQDKLPVRLEGKSLLLPIGSAASTHILKFPNPHYKHLPANEVFTLMIARSLGLPVVEAELWPLRKEGMCVVTRYDRLPSSSATTRLHQEDMCQALGLPASLKYQKEGGPSFAQCFEVLRAEGVEPLMDGQNLLRWLAFNVALFNADAHAKNLSLLYSGKAVRLAPFYDLLCTRPYERLATDLAMSVDSEFNPTQVRRQHWEALAETLNLGARFVLQTVKDLAEQVPDTAAEAAQTFKAQYGDSPALQLILPKIRRQSRRVLQLLS